MRSKFLCFVVSSLAVAVVACNSLPQGQQSNEKREIERTIATAIRSFPENRYGSIEDYDIRITDDKELNRWIVRFMRNIEPVHLGDWLMITIEKDSRDVRIIHGR